MRVVVCRVAGQRYAVSARQIVEVVPLVQPRPVPGMAAWFRGVVNYRGHLIPLLDMPMLLAERTCPARMGCRVLVVDVGAANTERQELLGLAVEQVEDVESIDFDAETAHADNTADEADYLGPVAVTDSGTVQLVYPERLPRWQRNAKRPKNEPDLTR